MLRTKLSNCLTRIHSGINKQRILTRLYASSSQSSADLLTADPFITPITTTTTEALTDTFGRHHTYLRISLTERCNLRCLYFNLITVNSAIEYKF